MYKIVQKTMSVEAPSFKRPIAIDPGEPDNIEDYEGPQNNASNIMKAIAEVASEGKEERLEITPEIENVLRSVVLLTETTNEVLDSFPGIQKPEEANLPHSETNGYLLRSQVIQAILERFATGDQVNSANVPFDTVFAKVIDDARKNVLAIDPSGKILAKIVRFGHKVWIAHEDQRAAKNLDDLIDGAFDESTYLMAIWSSVLPDSIKTDKNFREARAIVYRKLKRLNAADNMADIREDHNRLAHKLAPTFLRLVEGRLQSIKINLVGAADYLQNRELFEKLRKTILRLKEETKAGKSSPDTQTPDQTR